MSSENGSVQVASHFCMYCGMMSPPRILDSEFIGWICTDCNHVVCTKCVQDMNAVGKYEIECSWWNCKSNVQIKVRVKDQFEKPVVPKPYESFEGEIVGADRWYVEINVNREWMPIHVMNMHTDAQQEVMPTFTRPSETQKYAFGRREVRARFDLPMDDKNFQYLVQGTLVRASINLGSKLQTMFQGFICQTPTFSVQSQGLTMVQVEAIEGEVIEPPREQHSIDAETMMQNVENFRSTMND